MNARVDSERLRDRARRQDLLDQVADSREERDNVRRILGASQPETDLACRHTLRGITRENGLREADLDAAQRWREQPLRTQCGPEPAWVRWTIYPAVLLLTIAACYAWPLWVQP